MWNHQRVRLALFALSACLWISVAQSSEIKALWVWEEDTFRMLDDPTWRDDTLDRLRKDGFNTIYLYADYFGDRTPISEDRGLYEAVIEAARERGFRVEALLGSKYLNTNRYVMPDRQAIAKDMLERIKTYNMLVQPSARFDAMHLDIEPYTTDEWKADREKVVEWYVEAAREWRRIAHDGDLHVEIGAAIPFWFDRVERGDSTLVVALIESFDYVALMDYRDKAEGRDGIIEHARYEVDLAGRLGRKVIVGVETGDTELDKLTFLQEGRTVLDDELRKVTAAFNGKEGFAGVAIHHLSSYLRLANNAH